MAEPVSTTGSSTPDHRLEEDAFGVVQIPASKYWGAQTQRATAVFNIGHEYLPPILIQTIATQKIAAAKANHRLGSLDLSIKNVIVEAAQEVEQGKFDSHFPLTVWQTGSGTQTNMNLNEIIANRANELLEIMSPQESASNSEATLRVHPNDHVNCSQSSNDTFPTAMHIATLLGLRNDLVPSLITLRKRLSQKATEFRHVLKVGRTHLMDAVPMTLGQSFDAFARQIKQSIDRIEESYKRLRELPQGGTAVGAGTNAPKDFDQFFCDELNTLVRESTGEDPKFEPAESKFESMGAHDTLMEVSGVLNCLATSLLKIATDIRFLGSGPRCGLGELIIPHDGLTSSIMPGKINPTLAEMVSQIAFQVIGNHAAVTAANGACSNFELNVAKPVIIYNILQSIDILGGGALSFAENLVAGLKANEDTLQRNVERSLLQATSLNPVIGYTNVSKIVKKANVDNVTPREAALELGLVTSEQWDKHTDPWETIHQRPFLRE
ncbi:hypothetical protein Q7P37_005809 [Cladosporium fusiforme]